MIKPIKIDTPKGERLIGPGQAPFVIAEMSGNHNQSFAKAKAIIDAAVEAGVDAIKIQTYTADTLTIDSDKKWFQVKVNEAWAGNTLYSLYEKAYTPWDWQPKLKEHAEKQGVMLFSTPFDVTAVDFLENMNVKLYKIASFEVGDIPLLEKVGKTNKPVIISRGLASVEEIDLAIKTLKEYGCLQVAILHCISSYPAELEQMNLATIPDIINKFEVIAGLSDHSLGIVASLTAVNMGASIIEKHFTLDRSEGGPDASFSLEPAEMKELVEAIHKTKKEREEIINSIPGHEKVIGQLTYEASGKEAENVVFKRSLFIIKDVKQGEVLTTENVRVIRPGYGLAPKHLPEILGKAVKIDIERGTPLTQDLLG